MKIVWKTIEINITPLGLSINHENFAIHLSEKFMLMIYLLGSM